MVCCVISTSQAVYHPPSLRQRTETGSLELSGFLENFEEAQAFRATTLDSVRMYLALDCNDTNQDTDAT